jgi:hypothetical protein
VHGISSSGLREVLPVLQLMVDMQEAAKGRRPWGTDEIKVLKDLVSALRALPIASAASSAADAGASEVVESGITVSAELQQQQSGEQCQSSNGFVADGDKGSQKLHVSAAAPEAAVAVAGDGDYDSDDEGQRRLSGDDLSTRSMRQLQPQCLRLLKQLLDEEQSSCGKAD